MEKIKWQWASFNFQYSLFSIRYSNSWVQIVLFVFGIWSIFKKKLFGIRYSLNFQKRIYLVFGPYSLFVATLTCFNFHSILTSNSGKSNPSFLFCPCLLTSNLNTEKKYRQHKTKNTFPFFTINIICKRFRFDKECTLHFVLLFEKDPENHSDQS